MRLAFALLSISSISSVAYADMDIFEPGEPGPRVVVKPPPKPAPEIATQAKVLAGTWTCKGVKLKGDGSSSPSTSTLTAKLDLDGGWISLAMIEKGGGKFAEYRSFDGVSKQWTRIQMASTSGYTTTTTLGERDGKWTWTGTSQSPQGTLQVRDMEQLSGKSLKLWGEAMLGGNWQKLYEVTCTK